MALTVGEGAALCAPCAKLLARLYAAEPDVPLLHGMAEIELAAYWPLEDGAVATNLRHLQAEAAALVAQDQDSDKYSGQYSEQAGAALPILREEYTRLFVGCGMPQVPLWGSVYLDEENLLLRDSTLALETFWRHRGLACTLPGRQPLDHLALCLEGLALLLERCAATTETEADKAVADVRELLSVHVLPWIGRCTALGQERAHVDFFRILATLTQAFFSALLSFLDIKPTTRTLYY